MVKRRSNFNRNAALFILAAAFVASVAAFEVGRNETRYVQVAAVLGCEDPSCMPGPNECPTRPLGPRYTNACQPPQPGQPTPKIGLIGKPCTEKDGAVGGAIGKCLAACKCKGEKTTDGMMPMLPMLPMPMPKMMMPTMAPTGAQPDCDPVQQDAHATTTASTSPTKADPNCGGLLGGVTSGISNWLFGNSSSDTGAPNVANTSNSAWERLLESLGLPTGNETSASSTAPNINTNTNASSTPAITFAGNGSTQLSPVGTQTNDSTYTSGDLSRSSQGTTFTFNQGSTFGNAASTLEETASTLRRLLDILRGWIF